MMWDDIIEGLEQGPPLRGVDMATHKRMLRVVSASETPCFEITNIYQWVMDYEESHDKPSGTDVKPPAGSWFLEFNPGAQYPARFGIFVGVYPLTNRLRVMFDTASELSVSGQVDNGSVKDLIDDMTESALERVGEVSFKEAVDEGDYAYRIDPFIKIGNNPVRQIGIIVLADKSLDCRTICAEPKMAFSPEAAAATDTSLNMIIYFLMFLSAKNITVQSFRIPSERINKRRAERGKPPLSIYKVLTIDPSKVSREFLPRMTDKGIEGLRLHFCRGHMKTYAEEAPLFGKRTGTWFWSPIMRGKKSMGEVHKTYKVLAEKKGGGDGGEKEGRSRFDG